MTDITKLCRDFTAKAEEYAKSRQIPLSVAAQTIADLLVNHAKLHGRD